MRVEITAVLVAEDGNPYDSNAIAVWIDGLKAGHLSRENACAYRPGLLALQRAHRMPIALTGVIVGGGLHDDGPGRLGVFLRHDPEDFGLRLQPPGARVHGMDRPRRCAGAGSKRRQRPGGPGVVRSRS